MAPAGQRALSYTRRYATAPTISSSAITGIGVVGGIIFLAILVPIVTHLVRRHDRIRRNKFGDDEVDLTTNDELASNIRSHRPRGISISNRSSFIPFLPPHQLSEPLELSLDILEDDPPLARTNIKRLSAQNLLLKWSGGIRDSWPLGPLGASMQMPTALRLQSNSNSTVTVNQVAPPGYIIPPDPAWLKRSYSRNTKNKVLVSAESSSSPYLKEPPSPSPGPHRQIPRRAISENHLSTILRSTSHRLKSTRRKSLSRALTLANRKPETHAIERLATPRKTASESKEDLIPSQATESAKALYQNYVTRTPSPGKKIPKMAGRANSKRKLSPSSSIESDDSLFVIELPECVFPSPLTSPSKRFASGEEQRPLRECSHLSGETSTVIHNDDRASTLSLGFQESTEGNSPFSDSQRLSLDNDPFYLSKEVVKPVPPKPQVNLSPRPLYIRKATFGQQTTPQKPKNIPSPLKDISGNRQTPPKSGQTQSSPRVTRECSLNPFQWSSQESIGSQSPSPKRRDPHQRGHKRSKVIRLSGLPRTSNVSIVHEDPDEDSSVFDAPKPSVRLVQPSGSRSPITPTGSLSRRLTVRPPSSPTFNPRVSVPKLVAGRVTDSPTLGLEIYSPTLVATNYYNEQSSEDEFFKAARSPKRSATITYKWHESSGSPKVPPSTKLHEMISFPAEDIKDILQKPKSPALSPNSEILKTLEGRKSSTPPPAPAFPAAAVLAAGSVLPIPIPGHLTGPRAEPPKRNVSLKIHSKDSPKRYSSQKLPARGSLASSICALRRMNSEVSICGSPTSQYSNSSPVHSESDSRNRTPEASPSRQSYRNSSRASKNYLMLGSLSSLNQRQRVTKRDTSRRNPPQHIHHLPDLDSEDDLSTCDYSSPESARNSFGVNSMVFSIPSNNSKTQQRKVTFVGVDSPLNSNRWSDAMPNPPLKSARRASQIQGPSPVDPLKWRGGRDSNICVVTTSFPSADEGKENAKNKHGNRSPARSDGGSDGNISPGTLSGLVTPNDRILDKPKKKVWGSHLMDHGLPRPDSMGLYDAQGFLKSSPDRDDGPRLGVGTR